MVLLLTSTPLASTRRGLLLFFPERAFPPLHHSLFLWLSKQKTKVAKREKRGGEKRCEKSINEPRLSEKYEHYFSFDRFSFFGFPNKNIETPLMNQV